MAYRLSSTTLSPNEIRYTQDSIGQQFSDGHSLSYTFAELLYGRVSVDSLPNIECVLKDGHWWATSGNRRLYIFKKLQDEGKLTTVEVEKKSTLSKTMTTKSSGLTIRVRQSGIGVKMEIDSIVTRWKRGDSFEAATVAITPIVAVQARRSGRRGLNLLDSDDDDDDCGAFRFDDFWREDDWGHSSYDYDGSGASDDDCYGYHDW